jgi:hypothetical protein
LRCYFLGNAQSSYFETELFQSIIKYISSDGIKLGLTLKQTKSYLIVVKEGVKNLKEAALIIDRIAESVE